ncbi:MAG: CBS domain-containing protein [Clostridia bacterium]
MGQSDVEAARLGDINKETRYALEYFGVEAPPLLGSLKPLVEDLNIYSTQSLRKTDILKTAMSVLSRQRGHVAPVVDDDNKIEGMISISDVTPVYLGLTGKSLLKITNTPIGNIMKAIDGEFLTLEKNMEQIAGDIYTESDWDEEISVRLQ